MSNGTAVAAFEKAFAEYVGAEYAIALCNGTSTLHTAVEAVGLYGPVEVPPLTMSATTMSVLHAGRDVEFADVDPWTWLMQPTTAGVRMPVSLLGLHHTRHGSLDIDDAAQTLRRHSGCGFTSYSFQASKILPLGEGGMLVTNDERLARDAREFSSLGYRMDPRQPRIDPATLKHPTFPRHHAMGWNYRMSDLVAMKGREMLEMADSLKSNRRTAASFYADAIEGCPWITPQHVPDGWEHDYWAFAVALESADMWEPFVDAVERHGGERPYAAWRLTYQEPAFRHLAEDGCCPVAEDLQPRLVLFQTNRVDVARVNADAVALAIRELDG